MEAFKEKVERLFQRHEELITRKNVAVEDGNGIFTRYKYPVVMITETLAPFSRFSGATAKITRVVTL